MSITHDTTHILLSDVEDGDSLRAYVAANSLGTVHDRTIIFDRHLRCTTTAEYSDSNYTYIFPGDFHFDFNAAPISFTLESGVIVYTGEGKLATTALYADAITLIDTQFRVEYSNGGRSDFNRDYPCDWAMSNVQFVNNASNSYLFFTLNGGYQEGVSIGGTGSPTSAVIGAVDSATAICHQFKLSGGISRIAPPARDGLTIFSELDWGNTSWNIGQSNRAQRYTVLNPVKPSGWVKYSGANITEKHTHNINVVDSDGAVDDYLIALYSNDLSILIFSEKTDANGAIAEKEIVTYSDADATGVFVQQSDFQIRGIGYKNNVTSGVRSLQNGRIDEILLASIDIYITESDKTIVDAYTTQDIPEKAYDHLKSVLVDNYSGEIDIYAATDLAKTLIDSGAYDVEIDGTGSGAPFITPITITAAGSVSVSGSTLVGVGTLFSDELRDGGYIEVAGMPFQIASIESDTSATLTANEGGDIAIGAALNYTVEKITLNAPVFEGDIITTGNVTVINGGKVKGNITDAARDSSLEFVAITVWEAYATIPDRTSKTNLIASGTSDDFYHFSLAAGQDLYLAVATSTGTENNVTLLADDMVMGVNEISLDNTALILALLQGQEDLPQAIHEYDYAGTTAPVGSFAELMKLIPDTAEIEGALLNEGDGQALLDAIALKIQNSNVDEVALIAALRADIERAGGPLDVIDDALEIINARTVMINSQVA